MAVWNPLLGHQCVALRDVRIAVRLGVYATEHVAPQPISVDVELYRRNERAQVASLADCLDYDRIYRHLTEDWPRRPHTELLEQLADALASFCLLDARIEACRVIIRKLDIYPDSAVPEIALFRLASAGGGAAA